MKAINTIEIEYDESKNKYWFLCPYCGKRLVLPDDIECEHYLFGFEGINQMPLYMKDYLWNAIEEKLSNHRTKGPETFLDVWIDQFRPEMEDKESYIEEYNDARSECIEYYLSEIIGIEDVFWFMDRLPELKGYRKHATIAMIDDGGGNCSSYLFFEDFLEKR